MGRNLGQIPQYFIFSSETFVRAISYLRKFDSTSRKFIELGILNVNKIYSYFSSLLIFKARNNSYCNSLFHRVEHGHLTRGSLCNMYVPNSRCKLVSKSFILKAPKIWNQLPENLKTNPNIISFKKNLKKHLILKQSDE